MQEHTLIARAAPPTIAVIRAIRPDQLDRPTPCREFDVRGVLDHMVENGPALTAAAGAPTASEADLESQIERLVAAWSVPAAWQGTTTMGGPMKLPATMVGAMVLGELVVHGWDLARATGQDPAWDAELLDFVHQQVAETAAMGREMHAYGPEVAVPATAPLLDRTLGLTGRDPFWKP